MAWDDDAAGVRTVTWNLIVCFCVCGVFVCACRYNRGRDSFPDAASYDKYLEEIEDISTSQRLRDRVGWHRGG